MINEIYINNNLVKTELPKSQFNHGYVIRCIECDQLIDRRTFTNTILSKKYICKKCVLTNHNPMKNKNVHDVWIEKYGKKNADKKWDKKCKNQSDKMKGDKNSFFGKTHTDITIKKIAETTEKNWNALDEGARNKIRKQRSVSAKKVQADLLKKDPIEYKRLRSKAANISNRKQLQNAKMNKIETIVYNYLKNELNVNVKFSIILASYQYDFGIKDERVLIEVDGDYWHGNPKFYNLDGSNGKRKLNNHQIKKIKNDEEKTNWAKSRGFKLVRIWECDINNNAFKKILNNELTI